MVASFTSCGIAAVDGDYAIHEMHSGDIDGDGDIDLIVVTDFQGDYKKESSLEIYLNDGNQNFEGFTISSRAFEDVKSDWDTGIFKDVKLKDLDKDGDLDLVVARFKSDEPLRLYTIINTDGHYSNPRVIYHSSYRRIRGLLRTEFATIFTHTV